MENKQETATEGNENPFNEKQMRERAAVQQALDALESAKIPAVIFAAHPMIDNSGNILDRAVFSYKNFHSTFPIKAKNATSVEDFSIEDLENIKKTHRFNSRMIFYIVRDIIHLESNGNYLELTQEEKLNVYRRAIRAVETCFEKHANPDFEDNIEKEIDKMIAKKREEENSKEEIEGA